ncbi:MAG: hypothetical protein JNL10_03755 [Verrucomicrobiales bacterium]|nr:hypothetical protein [Verrucomicrobiales bacterium]
MLEISAAQIDQSLAPRKAREGHRGRCGTKTGGLFKTQMPIRAGNWDITGSGVLEADTVAHCGASPEGDVIWSVTYTDIYDGWTANHLPPDGCFRISTRQRALVSSNRIVHS